MKKTLLACLAVLGLSGCLNDPGKESPEEPKGNPFIGAWTWSGEEGYYTVRDSLFRRKMDSAFAPVDLDAASDVDAQFDSISHIWNSVEDSFSCAAAVCDSVLRPYSKRLIFTDSSAILLTFQLMWKREDSPRVPRADTLKHYAATVDSFYGESTYREFPGMHYYDTIPYALAYRISKARDSLIFNPESEWPTVYLKDAGALP